jgi:hypothetical protein
MTLTIAAAGRINTAFNVAEAFVAEAERRLK